MKLFLLILATSLSLLAQTTGTASRTNNNTFAAGKTQTFLGVVDMGSATRTAPIKKGTSLPATCTTGDLYNKTDATAGANIYGCTSTNTWTVQTGGGGGSNGYTTVTFSSTPTFTAASATGTSFLLTLTGNVTSSTLSGAATGQIITFKICQDATGSRTFVWPTNVQNASTPELTALKCLNQTFVYDGTNAQALSPGFTTGVSESGYTRYPGLTSGAAEIGVADIAGTPNRLLFPTSDGAVDDFLKVSSIASGKRQLGWAAVAGGPTVSTANYPGIYPLDAAPSTANGTQVLTANKVILYAVMPKMSYTIRHISIALAVLPSSKGLVVGLYDYSGTLLTNSMGHYATTVGSLTVINMTLAAAQSLTAGTPVYFAVSSEDSTTAAYINSMNNSAGPQDMLNAGSGKQVAKCTESSTSTGITLALPSTCTVTADAGSAYIISSILLP